MGKTINLQQLGGLRQFVTEFSNLSDDYILIRITEDNAGNVDGRKPDMRHGHTGGPIRIEGMAWVLCFSGTMKIEMNLTPCTMTSNTLTVIDPGSIIEMKEIEWEGLDCYMLFVSSSFLRDVNFDINLMGSIPAIHDRHVTNQCITLSEAEASLLKEFFLLLRHNTESHNQGMFTKSIARNLTAALTYQIIQFYMARAETHKEPAQTRSRRSGYVHEFMKLVHQHHRSERSVAYYASRLFISPKYLSLIIKEHTGQSASEVIDSYVILEAKNLLRFSGKNIQQVAYELNFPNQSSFGKYFKHITGMSPSEYQRT